MWIAPAVAFGANPAPLPDQQRPAEQIRLDLHAVEAPVVALRPDARQARRLGAQRELGWHRLGRAGFASFGHHVAGSVSGSAAMYSENKLLERFFCSFCTVLSIVYHSALDPPRNGKRKGSKATEPKAGYSAALHKASAHPRTATTARETAAGKAAEARNNLTLSARIWRGFGRDLNRLPLRGCRNSKSGLALPSRR